MIFFLWGYLKSKVYTTRPNSVAELKERIEAEIEAIPQEMLRKVMDSVRDRVHECIIHGGAHLKNTVFKK